MSQSTLSGYRKYIEQAPTVKIAYCNKENPQLLRESWHYKAKEMQYRFVVMNFLIEKSLRREMI